MVEVGLAEEIEFIDDSSTDITNDFGAFASASFIIDETANESRGVSTGGKPESIIDGPVENRVTLSCKPSSLEVLKIMGTFDSNAGTITFDENLPEHDTLRGQFSDSKYFEFSNFKVGGFTLDSAIDATVTIQFDPLHAKTGEVEDGTITDFSPSGTPLQWTDTDVKIDGSSFGVIESVAGTTLDRNINPEYGLGQGREPAAVVEGNFTIQPSFVVKVEDAEPWEKLLDDTTYPLTVSDSRSPISEISFDFGETNGELVVEDSKLEINTFDMDEDKNDVRTVELQIKSGNIKVRNL